MNAQFMEQTKLRLVSMATRNNIPSRFLISPSKVSINVAERLELSNNL